MDSATDLILDYSLVQCTETTSSVAMEKEGLRRCLEKLMAQHVDISTIATDRHTGVASLMKTDYPHIIHQYDVWHLAKSVTKKLGKKAETKHCSQLFPCFSHGSSPFLTTYGGLHKVVKVMHNSWLKNGNPLCTTFRMCMNGTVILKHCSLNVCIKHYLLRNCAVRNG